jgi:hypothetical protein
LQENCLRARDNITSPKNITVQGVEMAAKKTKVQKVMGEFKAGTLHSGKGGPVVKSNKQAIAIALSEQAKANKNKKKKKTSRGK